MGEYLLRMFSASLGLTLLLEVPVIFFMGLQGRRYALLAVLVNVLTNPPAVLACWLGVPEIPVEAAVIAVEAAIYFWFGRGRNWEIPHPVWLSLVTNTLSWVVGLLIQR